MSANSIALIKGIPFPPYLPSSPRLIGREGLSTGNGTITHDDARRSVLLWAVMRGHTSEQVQRINSKIQSTQERIMAPPLVSGAPVDRVVVRLLLGTPTPTMITLSPKDEPGLYLMTAKEKLKKLKNSEQLKKIFGGGEREIAGIGDEEPMGEMGVGGESGRGGQLDVRIDEDSELEGVRPEGVTFFEKFPTLRRLSPKRVPRMSREYIELKNGADNDGALTKVTTSLGVGVFSGGIVGSEGGGVSSELGCEE